MKKCPLCGTENDDINTACAKCGTDLGYENMVLYEVYKRVDNIDKKVVSIKGWITFMGILVLIGLLLSLFGGCMAIF